jgi:large subunit ribosomal protein L35
MRCRTRAGARAAVQRPRRNPIAMPKMKTHSGAKKRFKITGTGKLRRRGINLNHILEKKSPRRKRRLTGEFDVASTDADRVKRMLGKR